MTEIQKEIRRFEKKNAFKGSDVNAKLVTIIFTMSKKFENPISIKTLSNHFSIDKRKISKCLKQLKAFQLNEENEKSLE